MPRSAPHRAHRTGTVVIGAGQAGLALSRHLTAAGHEHVVLERGRVGERWRTERWPSLRLLTPNWLNRLPGMAAPAEPHGFAPAWRFVTELEDYARSFDAPVLGGQAVLSVVGDGAAYRVRTAGGTWAAESVVVATGDCDRPHVPAAAGTLPPGLAGLHVRDYVAPEALPEGPVLVVGAGASGQQVALELRRAGRRVVVAAGGHSRMVRRHRGRDVFAWMAELGKLDESIDDVGDPERARRAHSPVLTGSRGGEELDLGVLRAEGVELCGRLLGFDGHRARFGADLPECAARADARLHRFLDQIDGGAGERPAPVEPGRGPASIDVRRFGVVLWATGYRRAYPWLHVPGVLGPDGELRHRHGATPAPGLHVLGLRFQSRRSSHFIGGVGRDAEALAARLTAGAARRAA